MRRILLAALVAVIASGCVVTKPWPVYNPKVKVMDEFQNCECRGTFPTGYGIANCQCLDPKGGAQHCVVVLTTATVAGVLVRSWVHTVSCEERAN